MNLGCLDWKPNRIIFYLNYMYICYSNFTNKKSNLYHIIAVKCSCYSKIQFEFVSKGINFEHFATFIVLTTTWWTKWMQSQLNTINIEEPANFYQMNLQPHLLSCSFVINHSCWILNHIYLMNKRIFEGPKWKIFRNFKNELNQMPIGILESSWMLLYISSKDEFVGYVDG